MFNTTKIYLIIQRLDCLDYAKTWILETLQIFLNHAISSELERLVTGHSIAQAFRLHSTIASVPFGTGVDLDISFGPK